MKKTMMGVGLIVLAGLLVFGHYLPTLSLPWWKLLLVAGFGLDALQNILRRDIKSAYIGCAIVFVLLNSEYGWIKVGIWTLLFALALAYCGIRILFPKKRTWSGGLKSVRGIQSSDGDVAFGSVTRYINDDDFKHGSADIAFGSADIYFDNARIVGDAASFTIDIAFGSARLHVPRTWRVDIQADKAFSTIEQEHPPFEYEKTLKLEVDLAFSSLEILYI